MKELYGPQSGRSHLLLWLHGPPGFLGGAVVENLPANAGDATDVGTILGSEDPLEQEMATHSSILAGESQGQRSLVGYSPWSHKESARIERLSTHIPCLAPTANPQRTYRWISSLLPGAQRQSCIGRNTHCSGPKILFYHVAVSRTFGSQSPFLNIILMEDPSLLSHREWCYLRTILFMFLPVGSQSEANTSCHPIIREEGVVYFIPVRWPEGGGGEGREFWTVLKGRGRKMRVKCGSLHSDNFSLERIWN